MRSRGVFRRRLAAPLGQAQQLDPAIGEPRHDLVGSVARGIRHDEDLASLGRVVELEDPLQRARDHLGFVVDRNRDADGGPLRGWGRPPGRAPQRAHELEQRGIAEVGIEAESQRGDEQLVRRADHRTSAAGAARETCW